jgi:hypothetical protein
LVFHKLRSVTILKSCLGFFLIFRGTDTPYKNGREYSYNSKLLPEIIAFTLVMGMVNQICNISSVTTIITNEFKIGEKMANPGLV